MNLQLFLWRLKIYAGMLFWHLAPIAALFGMFAFADLLLKFSWQGVVVLVALIVSYLVFRRLSRWWSDLFQGSEKISEEKL